MDKRHRGHGPIFRRGVQRAPALRGEVLMDDATRRRVRRAHARKLVSIFIGVMTVTALIGLYFSPLFRVQNIEVVGATDADRQQIADLVHSKGSSMLTVRFGGAEDRIAELPQIKAVQIDRSWPDGVRVTVVERQPWGTWIAGSTAYVIDDEGVVLPSVIAAPDGSLVIHALAAPPLSSGDRVDKDAVALTKAVVEQAPGRLALTVTEVDWSEADGLTVQTDAGYTVVIGDSENMDFKFSVWQQIETELGRDSMSGHVLDLRFGERPSFQ